MKDKGSLLIGVFGIFEIIYFFIYKPETETILGFEINGWLYLIIWVLITSLSFYHFYSENKK